MPRPELLPPCGLRQGHRPAPVRAAAKGPERVLRSIFGCISWLGVYQGQTVCQSRTSLGVGLSALSKQWHAKVATTAWEPGRCDGLRNVSWPRRWHAGAWRNSYVCPGQGLGPYGQTMRPTFFANAPCRVPNVTNALAPGTRAAATYHEPPPRGFPSPLWDGFNGALGKLPGRLWGGPNISWQSAGSRASG